MTLADLKAEALAQVDQLRRERDEARAEVERLRASVENLDALYVSRTDALRECEAALRTVAERQREACANDFGDWIAMKWHNRDGGSSQIPHDVIDYFCAFIRGVPVVTEDEK